MLSELFDLRPDFIIHAPHDFGRTFKPFLFQVREEDILFAGIVLLDGCQVLCLLDEGVQCIGFAIFPVIEGVFHGFQQAHNDLVFHLEGKYWMAGQRFGCRFFIEGVAEHSHMQVAQALDLSDGHALTDQGAFSIGNFAGGCTTDHITKFFF